MREITRRSGVLRTAAGFAAALGLRTVSAQVSGSVNPDQPSGEQNEIRLPNGKRQRDEILKSDYEHNLKDARELADMAKSFELELEKSDRFVLSIGLLKRLDDMEKLTRRIRGRMRR